MDSNASIFLAGLLVGILLLLFVAVVVLASRSIGRGASGNSPLIETEDGQFEIAGRKINCAHCGGARFKPQKILLNTWLLSLLGIDWLDSSASVLTCENCGRLTWFSPKSADHD